MTSGPEERLGSEGLWIFFLLHPSQTRAEDANNPEMPTGTDKNIPTKADCLSNPRTRKGEG